MNTSEQKSIVQYSTIVIIVIVFIIAFIYQNIEYMQLKMHYNAMIKEYQEVIEEYDREKYQLHTALSMDKLEQFAKERGLVPMTKESLIIIEGAKTGKK
ncbi:MAG: hypothetical protein N3F66_03025 [Spirochaetes bacterium]|nr:hypothetical protein [Spirochaetota bacterium]